MTASLFLNRFTRFTYSYDFRNMLFGCTPVTCDAFSLCSRIKATSAFSRVWELLKSDCGDRRVTQRVFGQIRVAQQHTGPQLQNTRIFIVLHASCHTGHLRPSLAAVALPKGAAAVARPRSARRLGVEGGGENRYRKIR